MTKKICAFTGHRPQNLPFRFNEQDERCVLLKRRLREEIEKQITENGVTHFISGMALGTDIYAAEIILEIKRNNSSITLEAAIPCEEQAVKWREKDRERYYTVLEQCDKETLLQKHYSADCMLKRNYYMVDSADVLIAVWDGSPSGTGKTVRYAQSCGKLIVQIDPNTL